MDGQPQQARAHAHDVHPGRARDPRARRHLPGADPERRPRRRRGRLRHLRREGRPPGPRRRHDHQRQQAGRSSPRAATTTPSRWSSPACTRSTATSTRSCRDALDKLRLNDAALVYEPETSTALGFGFRCGFLGLLHMEIVRERLEREFDLSLISTAPNVVYRVVMESGREIRVTNPSDFPGGIDGYSAAGQNPKGNTGGKIQEVYEPVVRATIISPTRLHRHDHGAVPEPPRRADGHGLPVHRPGGDPLHDAARARSSSTSSTSSSPGRGATRASTTSPTASRRPTWSRSTSCCRASRWTRSARSCTPTTPASTAWR